MDFQTENDRFLKFLLNASFFKGWSDNSFIKNLSNNSRVSSLELYVTTDCNQKCEYCYLMKHGDKLYPQEIRTHDNILKNLNILLKHVVKKWKCISNIDIFSGEIVGTELFYKILDLLLLYKKQGASYSTVMVPSNFSFILSEEQTETVQSYIEIFNENNVRLIFSASLDGLLIDDTVRPLNSKLIRDETFYNNAFKFAQKNNFCFHPMVSPDAIEMWVDNYKWFLQKCKEYDFDPLNRVMTLEVRNEGWTTEKINKYIEFLDFYTNYHYETRFGSDPMKFAKSILGVDGSTRDYVNYNLLDAVQIPTCSVSYQLTVRLGDLSIAPCHRTAYPDLLYGKFVVENDEIVDIRANNPAVATKILFSNQRKSHHGCDTCWNINSCIRGCFGAQYEYGQEIFMPIEDVCNLFKAKTKFLYEFYKSKGVIAKIKELNETEPTIKGTANIYLDMLDRLDEL